MIFEKVFADEYYHHLLPHHHVGQFHFTSEFSRLWLPFSCASRPTRAFLFDIQCIDEQVE